MYAVLSDNNFIFLVIPIYFSNSSSNKESSKNNKESS